MRSSSALVNSAPVVTRLIIGSMMFVHGLEKLTGDPAGFGGFLESLGVPLPGVMAWVVTLLELVGGAMLVLGLVTRAVAALMTVELIGAIVLVTGERGLIAAEGVGFERDLAYIAGFLVLVLLGPGRPSLDHLMKIERRAPSAAGEHRAAATT